MNSNLGGGLDFYLFSPLLGEDFQFDEHIFQMGWNHQLAILFRPFIGAQKITPLLLANMGI